MRTKKKNSKNKQNSKLKRALIQFSEYMFAGGVWFWSGYILIILLDDVVGLFAANFIGNAVGITLNFLLEKYWVFKTDGEAKVGIAAGRYVAYTAINAFGLNFLILFALREYAGIKPEIGQFIASAFFTGWNYYWYKNWVFKGQEHQKSPRTRHHA